MKLNNLFFIFLYLKNMSFSIRKPFKTAFLPSSGDLTYNFSFSPNPVGTRTDSPNVNSFSYAVPAFGNGRWVTSSTRAYESQRQLISTSPTAEFFDICGNYNAGFDINQTFFSNGRFFLATNAYIPYSTDGLNWVDVCDASLSSLNIGGFTNIPSTGRIVGIASNAAVYSDNSGNSWNVVSIPTFNGTKIAYNPDADILAAVSADTVSPPTPATVARSLDKGLTWTKHDISSGWFSGIAYGNGVFVAVNRNGAGSVWTSTDASNWTMSTNFTTANYAGFNPRSVAFGNGIFAVCLTTFANPWPIPPGPLGPGIIISRDNGNTWQALQTPYNTTGRANRWNGITYANGIFVVSAEVSSGPYNMVGKPFIPITYNTVKITPKYLKI